MRKLILAILLLAVPSPSWAFFPTTGILDTATRANENPLSDGSKWTTIPGFTALALTSNQIVVSAPSTECAMYWNPGTFKDSEVFVTINAIFPTTNDHMYIFARMQPASINGYFFEYQRNTTGVDSLQMGIITGGSPTALGTYSQNISNGDSMGMTVIGSLLTAWYKPSGGSWIILGTITDSTYTAAGNLALDEATTVGVTSGVISYGGGTFVNHGFTRFLR